MTFMKAAQMKKIAAIFLSCALLAGCGAGAEETQSQTQEPVQEETQEEPVEETAQEPAEEVPEETTEVLADGVYTADFDTDNSMFRVNEACDGKGTLTVENGEMTIHVSLNSQKIVNLYVGLAQDAQKDGAELLEPTVDTVTYSDGMTEEVYGFDVPVPVLDQEFDLALIGTKGKWYDHKVIVSNPEPAQEEAQEPLTLEDGTYTMEVTMEGGSGRASITSPTEITVEGEKITARVEWSSPNYDYMIVDGEKYLPVNTEGNSVFEIPVATLDEPMEVIGDTVAMSTPHEVEYTLTFHADLNDTEE